MAIYRVAADFSSVVFERCFHTVCNRASECMCRACSNVRTYTLHVRTYKHDYIQHAYIQTCMHTYIHTNLHTHIHTYLHTHIHTDMRTLTYPHPSPTLPYRSLLYATPSAAIRGRHRSQNATGHPCSACIGYSQCTHEVLCAC